MTREEFSTGIEIIEATLNKEMTEKQIKVYYDLLKSLQFKQFILGLRNLFLERVYTNIPSPAEIYQYCTDTTKDSIVNKAIIARNKFETGVRNCSAYDTVAFDDPVIHKIIVAAGGWIKVNKMDLDEYEKFCKFEFEKMYKAYSKNSDIGEIPLVLIGINDAANNIENPAPKKIIGDASRYKKMCLLQSSKIERLGLGEAI